MVRRSLARRGGRRDRDFVRPQTVACAEMIGAAASTIDFKHESEGRYDEIDHTEARLLNTNS